MVGATRTLRNEGEWSEQEREECLRRFWVADGLRRSLRIPLLASTCQQEISICARCVTRCVRAIRDDYAITDEPSERR